MRQSALVSPLPWLALQSDHLPPPLPHPLFQASPSPPAGTGLLRGGPAPSRVGTRLQVVNESPAIKLCRIRQVSRVPKRHVPTTVGAHFALSEHLLKSPLTRPKLLEGSHPPHVDTGLWKAAPQLCRVCLNSYPWSFCAITSGEGRKLGCRFWGGARC